MFDDAVRSIGRVESLSDVPILSARLPTGFVPQALGFGRRVEAAAIRRRWTTAVAAVALEFTHPRLESFDPVPKHQDKVGDGLGIALGKIDELFACRALRKHDEYPSL
jgi:hypothetical protein